MEKTGKEIDVLILFFNPPERRIVFWAIVKILDQNKNKAFCHSFLKTMLSAL
jgi:hypothetical protein